MVDQLINGAPHVCYPEELDVWINWIVPGIIGGLIVFFLTPKGW